MSTNPQLQLANDFVQYTGQNIFLTGKAGTGKTTFLRDLKKRSPKRMIVVAPTGVAAINAGGMTIHSFFQLSFAPQMGDETEQTKQKHFVKRKINIIRSLDLLVIDEISMVRADVLDAIDRVLRRYRRNEKPFGGVQLLMIGDLQQLAPVVKNDEWQILRQVYDTVFFFSSKALRTTSYVSIELTYVYRQQDEHFINILNKVRENKLDRDSAEALNKRYDPHFKVPKDSDYITLCTHNAQAKRINDSELALLKTKEGLMRAQIEGNFPEYSYPTDEELYLKEGAQVMFVKNDPEPEKRFFNGKIGKITHLSKDTIRVQCPGDAEEIDVSPLVWENIKYSIDEKTAEIKEEVEGKFTQIPLKTAWAITIHKSQGLTFAHAVIDAQASFAHGQVYVALSRCKTMEGMVLSSPIDERSIISDTTVNGFIHQVEENQPDEDNLQAYRNLYQGEVLNEVFDYTRLLYLLRGMLRVMNENRGSFPDDLPPKVETMNAQATQHLSVVAKNFATEVRRLINDNPDVETNTSLQDRVKKAVAYFEEKTLLVLQAGLVSLDLEIDNKTISKQYARYLGDLKEELGLKIKVLGVCKSGFSVKKVLDTRAKLALDVAQDPIKSKTEYTSGFENLEHPELFKTLRQYRYEKSQELSVPAYIIFSQKALADLMRFLPIEIKALKGIKGIGAAKIKQFGPEIIEIIADYCRDKGIERGQLSQLDFEEETKEKRPKKEKAPKVETKQVTYDLFKSGKTVEEIVEERGLTQNTILNHLTYYVAKGELSATDFVPEGKLKIIAAYFAQTKDYALKSAKEHFGAEMDYGELRMGLSYYLSEQV